MHMRYFLRQRVLLPILLRHRCQLPPPAASIPSFMHLSPFTARLLLLCTCGMRSPPGGLTRENCRHGVEQIRLPLFQRRLLQYTQDNRHRCV
jgi:hypothetical protein